MIPSRGDWANGSHPPDRGAPGAPPSGERDARRSTSGIATATAITRSTAYRRYPHIHFEVYSSLSAATSGKNAKLTSQFAMPGDICTTVFNNATGYSKSITNFAAVTIINDNVFGDNISAQIAVQTPR